MTVETVPDIQGDLHFFASRLARLERGGVPESAFPRWHFLKGRLNLLEAQHERSLALQAAYADSGDTGAALALRELVEHFAAAAGHAAQDVKAYEPTAVQAVRDHYARKRF